MSPDQIPPEVVEAMYRAWAENLPVTQDHYAALSAGFRAGLRAWPGMEVIREPFGGGLSQEPASSARIILPLPYPENKDG